MLQAETNLNIYTRLPCFLMFLQQVILKAKASLTEQTKDIGRVHGSLLNDHAGDALT